MYIYKQTLTVSYTNTCLNQIPENKSIFRYSPWGDHENIVTLVKKG